MKPLQAFFDEVKSELMVSAEDWASRAQAMGLDPKDSTSTVVYTLMTFSAHMMMPAMTRNSFTALAGKIYEEARAWSSLTLDPGSRQ